MPPAISEMRPQRPKPPLGPFRRAVLRGLAILLPPLLTIVIFVWVGNTVMHYVLVPLEDVSRWAIVEYASDIRSESDLGGAELVAGQVMIEGTAYKKTADDKLIPRYVFDEVEQDLGKDPMPPTAKEIYERYVNVRWLQRQYVVPIFLCVFVLVIYLLGRFLAAGVGRFFWTQAERVINRLPLVRIVYSSVKQVTDFLITDPDIQYTRVVAVEWPRKGIWMIAFVTSESMLDIRDAAGEPILAVLVPTSPMPFTGFTVTVKKSETVDLNITLDQAFQFIISCGVVVPPQQIADALADKDNGIPHEAGQPPRLKAPVADD